MPSTTVLDVIPVVRDHFGSDDAPIIEQVFIPAQPLTQRQAGWRPAPTPGQRLTRERVVTLRRQGASAIALRLGSRVADFRVAELLENPSVLEQVAEILATNTNSC
jgi:hypothetical protein